MYSWRYRQHRPDNSPVIFTIILTIIITCSYSSSTDVLVNTRQGPIRGKKVNTDNRTPIFSFLGIPYAAPPTGNNRFAAPQRHEGWSKEEPLSAVEFGPACMQPVNELQPTIGVQPSHYQEDCLFLNVWTAEATVTYRNAPVVVFLEGEDFITGYPGRLPGVDLAAEGVVFVSVSYRLNVFGFLCFGESEVRGNLGLLDQYMALIWVRENIEEFGGDPRSVTLMGHSAGAASVSYHMLSPRTQGLFHRAIIMSGSVTSPWSRSSHPSNSSLDIARSLGCLRPRIKTVINCLRSKSSDEILKAFETVYMNGNWSQLPLPVVDDFLPENDRYLPTPIDEALSKGLFLKIPVLTGISANEGSLAVSQWTDVIREGYNRLRQLFIETIIPQVTLKYNLTESLNYPEILTILRWYYLDPVRTGDFGSLVSKIIDFYSDSRFKAPHYKQMQSLANLSADPLSTVYAYQFEQDENYLYKQLNISGAGHGEELLLLFGPTVMKQIGRLRFTSAEEKLSSIMKRFWVEFIRKGSLSSSPYGYGISWKRYFPAEDNYIIFRADNNLPATQPVMRSPVLSLTKDALARQMIWLWNDLLHDLKDLHSGMEGDNGLDPTEMQLTKTLPYRSAMYTLIAFVVVLLVLLIICVVLLKKHATERERDMF